MTISSTASEISYVGDNVSVTFPIPFVFDAASDLKVIRTDADGNPVVLSSGFTVSGGSGSTGSLTLTGGALASGYTLRILDNPLLTQTADYIANDDFPAESHERALDRGVRISKRLYQLAQRALRTDDGDPISGAGTVLGSVQARKGKYLFFNAVTGAIEYATAVIGSTLSQSIIGQFLNPQIYEEASNSVTPVNYAYQPGDVLRYGADPTGSLDSSAAFQAAVNTGLPVQIPKGVFRVSGVVFSGKVVWRGQGRSSVIQSDGDVLTVTNGSDSSVDNIYLENLTAPWIITRDPGNWGADVSGTLRQSNDPGYQPTINDSDVWNSLTSTQQNQNIGPRIYFQANAQNIQVSRIYGRFARIELYDAQRSVVRDCNFRAGKGFAGAVVFWNANAQEGRFNRALNNHVSYASYCGIVFRRNDDFLAEGNTIELCGESGIKTYQGVSGQRCHNGTLSGNKSNRNYYDGLDTASTNPLSDEEITNHLVVGNECFGNGGTGINADGQCNSYIANRFTSNQKYGFWGLCSNSLISGNFFYSNNTAGNSSYHEILGGNVDNVIEGNVIVVVNGGISKAIRAHNAHIVRGNVALGGALFDFDGSGSYSDNIDYSTGFATDQCFVLGITNASGTLKHNIIQQSGATALGNYSAKINGASAASTTTPTGTDSSTAMAAGGKIGSASPEVFWCDTASQVAANAQLMASVIYNDTGNVVYCRPQIVQTNINGVDQPRLRFQFMLPSGSVFALNTTNIPSGKTIQVQFLGKLA